MLMTAGVIFLRIGGSVVIPAICAAAGNRPPALAAMFATAKLNAIAPNIRLKMPCLSSAGTIDDKHGVRPEGLWTPDGIRSEPKCTGPSFDHFGRAGNQTTRNFEAY